jgi:hypothetical protein
MQISGISTLEASVPLQTSMAGIGPGLGRIREHGELCPFQPVARITMILLILRTTGALHCHYNLYKAVQKKLSPAA